MQKNYKQTIRNILGEIPLTAEFYFQLKNDPKGLPKVKGGDDAAKAFWLPLAELDATMMFEDHYAIITKMVGL